MPIAVGLMFDHRSAVRYYSPGDLALQLGMEVVAESERGLEGAVVVTDPMEISEEEIGLPLPTITRIMTEEDQQRREQLALECQEAFALCQELIEDYRLRMKLIEVMQTFDGKRMRFYYAADEKPDLSELVRDLSGILRKKVQLHQVGIRDVARQMGGCGPCGRELCCGTWARSFESVTIRMAKEQGVSLNPAKLAGVCGKLKCCLRYESAFYKEMSKYFPKLGAKFETPKGTGKVVERNMITQEIVINVPEYGRQIIPCPVGHTAAEDDREAPPGIRKNQPRHPDDMRDTA